MGVWAAYSPTRALGTICCIPVLLIITSSPGTQAGDRLSAPVQYALVAPEGAHVVAVVPTAPSVLGVSPGLDQTGSRGLAWTKMSCPSGIYLRAGSMASSQVGFAVGELGIVLRTTDGGNSWQYVLSQGFPYYYYGVHAFGEKTVIITGFNNQTGEGILRWSDDGGTTWNSIVALSAPTVLDWLAFVRFIDESNGVIQGWGGGVFYTTTGGRTAADWHFTQPTDNWWLGPFTFLPDRRVWMTGYDNFRSLDGGATWTRIADASPLFDGPNSILADGQGFIGGGTISPSVSGWVYATSDGGDSWTPAPVLTTPYPIRALLRLNDQRGWAVGGNVYSAVGGIWGTEDGGKTWTLEQNTGAELLDITAVPVGPAKLKLYAVGMVSQIWRATLPLFQVGDLNCDGVINAFDIDPFVLALTDPAGYAAAYPNCDRMLADINGDGKVDAFDIDPFVDLLTGG